MAPKNFLILSILLSTAFYSYGLEENQDNKKVNSSIKWANEQLINILAYPARIMAPYYEKIINSGDKEKLKTVVMKETGCVEPFSKIKEIAEHTLQSCQLIRPI